MKWGSRPLDSYTFQERLEIMQKCDVAVLQHIKQACGILNAQAKLQDWHDLVRREYGKLDNVQLAVVLRKGVRRYSAESGVPEKKILEIADRYDILS